MFQPCKQENRGSRSHMLTAERCAQSWTSPGSNTPQDTNCTATCPLSRKLFKLDEPDMQDTAGEAEMNSLEMYSYGSPHMAAQKQGDQPERTFSSYVRIQDVVLKTYLGRWTIGRSGERGSGISVLPARYDDDDDDIYTGTHWLNDQLDSQKGQSSQSRSHPPPSTEK